MLSQLLKVSLFLLISIVNSAAYNCDKLNCSSKNTKCKIFGCSPMFGCFETSKCPQSNVDACHINTCVESTGVCVANEINCDDGNPNTRDWCHGLYGCQYEILTPTPTPSCEQTCNDNNPCTIDYCDFRNDCYHNNNTCNDFNACTNDFCNTATGCSNVQKNCDDNNPCTADFCSTLYGCYHEPVECSIKVPCQVDSHCNRGNGCETFVCDLNTNTCDYYAKNCDGNPCINNQCTTGAITN